MAHSITNHRKKSGEALFKEKYKDKKRKVTDTGKKAVEVLVGEHSRYQIKSGFLGGTFVARAFPKPPTKARGMIAEATGATEEAAIAALHDVIDTRETRRTDNRRTNSDTGETVVSLEEYAEAIRQGGLSSSQVAMLTTMSLAGADGLSVRQMAAAAGYKSLASANRAFVSAGVLIGEYLGIANAKENETGVVDATTLLGYRAEPDDTSSSVRWILHSELREAVRSEL